MQHPESQQLPEHRNAVIITQMSEESLIGQLGQLNQSALWASCLWGAVAGGYCIYGMKQKSLIPFLGGVAMTAASFMLGALTMSLACIALIYAVHWLLKQGY
jgi:hypothetical protein